MSRRDGVNYVFNGQHTIEIVATVSGSRETPVWCMIYDSLDYKNEADIFANQMKHVRPLKPYEIFMANIEAGMSSSLLLSGSLNPILFLSGRPKHMALSVRLPRWSESTPNMVTMCLTELCGSALVHGRGISTLWGQMY